MAFRLPPIRATDLAAWREHLRRHFGENPERDARLDALQHQLANEPTAPTDAELDRARAIQRDTDTLHRRELDQSPENMARLLEQTRIRLGLRKDYAAKGSKE